jgi:nucleotide-binding universal stress UspA family protein
VVDRLLVPLDDSELSEVALGQACELAKQIGVPITLLSVVTSRAEAFGETNVALVPGAGPSTAAAAVEDEVNDAQRRLHQVRGALAQRGVHAETNVVTGQPAEAIVAMPADLPDTLICMATHGRGGVVRMALGSVADEVARKASAPVLLVGSG